MLPSVFTLTAILLVIVNGMLVFSIVRPSQRIWPPPAQQKWQYYVVWLMTILSFGGFITAGILDWNGLDWSVWIRWPVGLTLIIGGNILAWVGLRQLTLKTTSGHGGPLVTDGLYHYSRNPQYIGEISIIVGWAILSASAWAIPLCLGGILAFVITPFAEEPWLAKLHGDPYREFRRRVPRFFGFHFLKACLKS